MILGLLAFHFTFVDAWLSTRDTLKNNPALREGRFLFSAEDFDITSALGHAYFAWAAIAKAEENEAMFLLYFQNKAAHIIPKASFGAAGPGAQKPSAQVHGEPRQAPGLNLVPFWLPAAAAQNAASCCAG